MAHSLSTGQPTSTKTPTEDPEINLIPTLRRCQAVYCYPLTSKNKTFGLLVFGHPESEFFDIRKQEVLDIVGRQAVSALMNSQIYHALEEETDRLIGIQEDARKSLARDLHDGPTQSIAAIAMRVNFARRLISRDVNKASEELMNIETLARDTTKEIRHMLFTLRPLVLETSGLVAALYSMAEKMWETYSQKVIIEAEKSIVENLDMGKQGVVFFITEEAINNARKHAEAEHIWVRLIPLEKDLVLLEIEDDGIGFDLDKIDDGYEDRGSLGMVNMRERVALINGVINVESYKGRGTQVRVWIPLTDSAAEKLLDKKERKT